MLVVLAVVLLAGLWYLPPVLKPGIGATPGGVWAEFPTDRQVLLVTGMEPHGWGGVEIRSVDDLSGARVVDAWAVSSDLWSDYMAAPAQVPAPGSARDLVASLGLGDVDRLPRTLPSGGEATLVVLWQLDDCASLTRMPPTVNVAARWGATRADQMSYSPFSVYTYPGAGDRPCGT